MLFTIRVHCGCGCLAKFTVKWGLTGKGSKYTIAPGWDDPSRLSVSQLPEAFACIKNWAERGGKVANITLERVNDSEKVLPGNPCAAQERDQSSVFYQTGIRVCPQQK